ncbi:hypothetical protein [Salirhabdus salicampi]|uniref:hypothetical protein n=1 Tax=Salirhabdus salicampi TaxID=476102 RepID=UPI0020C1FE6A|nr:hypothetical protein [Salirhabdus salicampi]MCP8616051.1 hypothetical protein [Salirhabdus salicampi]
MIDKKILFVAFLILLLVGCSQNKEEYLIEGTIISINKKGGYIEVEGPMTIIKSATHKNQLVMK